MEIPATLKHKIDVYRSAGHVIVYDEPFVEPSWLALYNGLGVRARRYDLMVDAFDVSAVRAHLAAAKARIREAVAAMPSHAGYIARHCNASAA
jgi:tryptophan halogenase